MFAGFGLFFLVVYFGYFLFFDPEYNQPVDMGTLKSEAYAFDDDSDSLDMAQAALFMSVNE
mgnify:CR=1 FL=1